MRPGVVACVTTLDGLLIGQRNRSDAGRTLYEGTALHTAGVSGIELARYVHRKARDSLGIQDRIGL